MKSIVFNESMAMNQIRVSFDENLTHIFGIKSPILWKYNDDNSQCPLCYFRKPKHVSDNEFKHIINLIKTKLNN